MTPQRSVLRILHQNVGATVSGEEIASALGCSRMSVTKYVAKLREMGLEIESNPRKGHKLISLRDVLNADTVSLYLPEHAEIVFLEETDSTNNVLKNTPLKNAVAVARTQSGGRGRRGRSFVSAEGGTYFSVKFRPDIPPIKSPLLTLAAGIAVAETLGELGVASLVKFPNDCYIDNRKVCGILTECLINEDEIDYAIVGIGINVTNALPDELSDITTKLSDHVQSPPSRAELIGRVLTRFDEVLTDGNIPKRFEAVDYCLNREIYLSTGLFDQNAAASVIETAIYRGVTDEGYMIAEVGGERRLVTSGEISIRRTEDMKR